MDWIHMAYIWPNGGLVWSVIKRHRFILEIIDQISKYCYKLLVEDSDKAVCQLCRSRSVAMWFVHQICETAG